MICKSNNKHKNACGQKKKKRRQQQVGKDSNAATVNNEPQITEKATDRDIRSTESKAKA